MNDLDVFNEEPAPQQQKLAIAEAKRPPSYFEFSPLWMRWTKLKPKFPKTQKQFLASHGAFMEEPKGGSAKAPEITKWTWEKHDEWRKEIEELEAAAAAKAPGKPAAKAEKPKAEPATAEVKPRTQAQINKEFERLLKLASKKGYSKEDLQATIDHITQDGNWNESALLEFDKYVKDLEDISDAGLKKAAKAQAEKDAAEFATQIDDRIGKLLATEVRNPFSQKVYTVRDVLKRLAKIRSLMQTRENEYKAEMAQLESDEQGWLTCYGASVNCLLIDEFNARRYKDDEGKTIEFKPATVKLSWLSAKRKPVKGGPVCKDRDKEFFKLWVEDDLKKPEVQKELTQSLTQVQKEMLQKCFRKTVSIDWDACERAVRAGVKLPHWTIQEADDIGEPELYFSKPRQKKAGVSVTTDEDEDDV